jgi:undecaprenyl-diphosphatase
VRIIRGLFSSIRYREIYTVDQKLAWMLVLATIPVGLAGLAFEHTFRVVFGHAKWAAFFLIVNGVILVSTEKFRRRSSLTADRASAREREHAELVAVGRRRTAEPQAARLREQAAVEVGDRRLATLPFPAAVLIGSAQILGLLAGISRDGVTMCAGLWRGLSREDAARFAFLLATPVILAAGALKLPDLAGPLGQGIHGQILLASVLSGVGAYLSVRFLVRYLRNRTLTPFGIYCLIFGAASLAYLTLVK